MAPSPGTPARGGPGQPPELPSPSTPVLGDEDDEGNEDDLGDKNDLGDAADLATRRNTRER